MPISSPIREMRCLFVCLVDFTAFQFHHSIVNCMVWKAYRFSNNIQIHLTKMVWHQWHTDWCVRACVRVCVCILNLYSCKFTYRTSQPYTALLCWCECVCTNCCFFALNTQWFYRMIYFLNWKCKMWEPIWCQYKWIEIVFWSKLIKYNTFIKGTNNSIFSLSIALFVLVKFKWCFWHFTFSLYCVLISLIWCLICTRNTAIAQLVQNPAARNWLEQYNQTKPTITTVKVQPYGISMW